MTRMVRTVTVLAAGVWVLVGCTSPGTVSPGETGAS